VEELPTEGQDLFIGGAKAHPVSIGEFLGKKSVVNEGGKYLKLKRTAVDVVRRKPMRSFDT
jgi:hypothetical protein